MPYTIFAANKNKTGGALFVSFNSKDQSAYFTVFKQVDFDENNQKKNFDFKTPINVKFSIAELGGFIQAIRNKTSYRFYHSFNDDKTQGGLSYYEIEDKGGDPKKKRIGFGFKVDKNGDERKVSIGVDNAESLGEYLKFALTHIFSSIYSDDKKKAEEFAKKNEKSSPPAKNSKSNEYLPDENEPPPVAEETKSDDDDIDF